MCAIFESQMAGFVCSFRIKRNEIVNDTKQNETID